MELKDIRAEIDKIDDNIKKLLVSRNEQTLSVAKAKASNKDLKILNTDRENEIITRLTNDLYDKNKIKNVMKSIFIESRTAQYKYFAENKLFNLNFDDKIVNKDVIDIDEIVLQGIEGSYAEQASNLFFNSKKSFEKDFEGVFKRVKGNTLGLVPIDNSSAGTVGEVYDLLQKYNLFIVGSKNLKIEHSLLSKYESNLNDIKVIYSHPQALMQSSKFLNEHNIEGISVANTAVAADMVSNSNRKDVAAICSIDNSKRYNLKILNNNVNNYPSNFTRFILLSDKFICNKSKNSTISIIFNITDEAGSLNNVMSIFSSYNISLSKIESRPNCLNLCGNKEWKYIFYADFTADYFDNNTRALLFELYSELPYVKLLGCYKELMDIKR